MVKDVILALRRASNDRGCVAVVFTGAGDRAFCTGGNTAEYAEYYAGRPEEYRQYMRLFNDMVTAILMCDKPVICRVNGMRIAGGQEIGMACDFTVAQDLALFGQAGPRHGSAPDGGCTDFLPLFVGVERAMESCTLCEPWSAHKALRLGLITERRAGAEGRRRVRPQPAGRHRPLDRRRTAASCTASSRTGEEREPRQGAAQERRGRPVAARREVEGLVWKLAHTMPGCLTKTIESVRKHKLEHWDRNKETNRAWLALNMMTEGRAGFRAFHEGTQGVPRGRLPAAAPAPGRGRAVGRGADRGGPGQGPRRLRGLTLRARAMEEEKRADDALPALEGPVRLEALAGGAVWALVLDTPKANILDGPKVRALSEAFLAVRNAPPSRPSCSRARGRTSPSAPASRSTCPSAWPACCAGFHGLFRTMLEVCACRRWRSCAASAWAARWSWPASAARGRRARAPSWASPRSSWA